MDTSKLQIIKQRYNVVGNCDALNRALDVALQVAPTDLSVLIIGESGVGKEIIPRVIHDNSPRKREKYFAINCGSIPEGTIDSELFGHEKGSYTGAIGESEGYFGIANKGTLFLDEVGELPMATQARLLRVLETGEYIRVGGQEIRKTNVRIVAATNVNMRKAISEGSSATTSTTVSTRSPSTCRPSASVATISCCSSVSSPCRWPRNTSCRRSRSTTRPSR